MKTTTCFAIVLGLLAFTLSGRSAQKKENPAAPETAAVAPIFTSYADLKWEKILPDLGADSPEICMLYIDPKTHATQLMIRTPTAIHVRKHWHTANETHTLITGTAVLACEGKRIEMVLGSFNACQREWSTKPGCPPARSPSSPRWRVGHQLSRRPAHRWRFDEIIGRVHLLDDLFCGKLLKSRAAFTRDQVPEWMACR